MGPEIIKTSCTHSYSLFTLDIDSKLAESHISSTRIRSPNPQHTLNILSADLQELIASGMLTLKSKLDAVMNDVMGVNGNGSGDTGRFLGRMAESWWFFFGIVPVS